MAWDIPGSGIYGQALRRFVEEQLFTLPGTRQPREELTVLLTGSRAFGAHGPGSDVDLEVLCRQPVYDAIQQAMVAEGRTRRAGATLYVLEGDDWGRYYGPEMGRPHFSLTPLEEVARQFGACDDVWVWIWQNARAIHDPGDQFARVRRGFRGYPRDVLVRKIKYRWMLAAYWGIEVCPGHPAGDSELLPAAMGIANAVAEFQRFFFLVEGRPFPYAEKLPAFVGSTRLWREFGPFLQRAVELAVGRAWSERDPWERLGEAGRLLFDSDTSPECCRLEEAAYAAMLAAGVEADWVAADFRNIDELLQGKLGPMP